jgi:internalin A
MSRLMLCGLVSWLVMGSPAARLADDAEDKAVALVNKLGGRAARDDARPGKPVVSVELAFAKVTRTRP